MVCFENKGILLFNDLDKFESETENLTKAVYFPMNIMI